MFVKIFLINLVFVVVVKFKDFLVFYNIFILKGILIFDINLFIIWVIVVIVFVLIFVKYGMLNLFENIMVFILFFWRVCKFFFVIFII